MKSPVGEQIKKILLIISGILLLLVGIIGLLLPVFPTVPFLFLSLLCFMRVSKRFKVWVRKNKFYKKYLAKYEKDGKLPVRLMIFLGTAMFLFILIAVTLASVLYFYIQRLGGFTPLTEKIKAVLQEYGINI